MYAIDCRVPIGDNDLVLQWCEDGVVFISDGFILIRDSEGERVRVEKEEVLYLVKALNLAVGFID